MLILDTDHVEVLRFDGKLRDLLVRRLEMAEGQTVATIIITVQENLEGWFKKINENRANPIAQLPYYEKISDVIEFYQEWLVLPFDRAAVNVFMRLKGSGVTNAQVGVNDLKIAAIAMSNNGTVLTRNTQHFQRIPELMVEDWLLDDLS